jgi:molybdopterin synthase catalytic subunit
LTDFPTITLITEEEIDLNDLIGQVTLPSTGAAAIFAGMVRGITLRHSSAQSNRDHPHETVFLEYEAYKPMAEAKMKQVADEIRARWNTVEGIAIVQRIGRLYPCTPTVLIACTSPHRDTGVFDAARYGIDRLKEIVPVWKKEIGPSGEKWVEGDYIPGAVE